LIKVPEVFQPLIRPRDEKKVFRKLDEGDLKDVQATLDLRAREDMQNHWQNQLDKESMEVQHKRRANRIRFS